MEKILMAISRLDEARAELVKTKSELGEARSGCAGCIEKVQHICPLPTTAR